MGDEIYHSHLDVFLLWACRETGVIAELIDGPKSPDTVAERTGITDRAATVTLEALADMGYLEESDGKYGPTAELDGFRPETDVLDKGILPHRLDVLEGYMDLPKLMRTGATPQHEMDELRRYMGAMATIEETTVRAVVTAAEHAHPQPDRVLDVGGGPGRLSTEFVRRGADVTLFDIPPVIDLLADHHAEAGLETVAGDATESLPDGFDLVFSSRVILTFSPTELRDYFDNAFTALDPGGTFMCTERTRDHSNDVERFAAHMLTISPDGHTHTAAEYKSALEGAGFVDPAVTDIPGTGFQAIVGHKPA
ncbi:class I SAM-dependent methyltransferase [Halobacteriaceae bacterium SHR40]|uniref:methyltransferase n=1 Tax=Halovenus amylolytica TaxID=2500550 RepID=UPI000FE44256